MRIALAVAVVLSAPCWADDVEVFVDRGETFVRAGSDAGLQRGTSVVVVGKGGKRLGTATVMETWPALARVSLDEAARGDKSPVKYVTVGATRSPAVAPPPPSPPPPPPPPSSPGAVRRPLPSATGTAAETTGSVLKGHATYGGAGRWTAIQLFNDSTIDWTECTLLLLPLESRYALAKLVAQDHELIARSNFDNPDFDREPTAVRVTCRQGEAKFPFN